MGIYLPNMEMPKGRPVCIVIDAAGQARRYDLNNDRYADKELFETVSVPPHGRLIDADKLDKAIGEEVHECAWDNASFSGYRVWDLLDDAPTIIPEETAEEE